MATKRVWSTLDGRDRRRARIRRKVHGTAEHPRLCVYRSLKHMYAQIVDDDRGCVLVSASSREKGVVEGAVGNRKDLAKRVGKMLAERAIQQKIQRVCFDRSGYLYHGRVKALAEAARESGLEL